MLKAVYNKCKIEVIDDYAGIQRPDGAENLQKGILRACTLMRDHLTASTGHRVESLDNYEKVIREAFGKVVYWEQYADSGAIIEENGKRYAFVPWYRLIAVNEEDK